MKKLILVLFSLFTLVITGCSYYPVKPMSSASSMAIAKAQAENEAAVRGIVFEPLVRK